MTRRPFELDRDFLGSPSAKIIKKSLISSTGSSSGGDRALLTTEDGHGFFVGDTVQVGGVDQYTFDGVYTIINIPSSTTFEYKLIGDLLSETDLTDDAWAVSPAPSFLRYPTNDAVYDNAASYTTLMAEPWDYNTIRIVWGIQGPLDKNIKRDIAEGLVPRIAIVRSSFGHPVTPLDGEKILDVPYSQVLPTDSRSRVSTYFETQEARDYIFKLPPTDEQSLYDRNLNPGSWHYYSLFYFVKGADSEQQWVYGASDEAITPANHGHKDKLYDLLPEYYRSKDQEFTYGTGREGVMKSLISVVGMELDYTKTLADSLEDIYNVDKAGYIFLHLLGETNLGVESEDGLGDIRYRSILAAISRLYDERGSRAALQELTLAATKYNCKILEGINIMCLPDDSEFSDGTGSWGDPVAAYSSFSENVPWLGDTVTPGDPGAYLLNKALVGYELTGQTLTEYETQVYSVSERGGVLVVQADSAAIGYDAGYGTVVTCGLGTGYSMDRHRTLSEAQFYPQLNGIRCKPGEVYEFSAYLRLVDGDEGSVALGVLWFNIPKDPGHFPPKFADFNISRDFIPYDVDDYSTSYTAFSEADWDSGNLTRLETSTKAPKPFYGETAVYAVPYIAFDKDNVHHVSGCMFNKTMNSAQSFAVEVDPYLTLGVSSETLGSTFKLGS